MFNLALYGKLGNLLKEENFKNTNSALLGFLSNYIIYQEKEFVW